MTKWLFVSQQTEEKRTRASNFSAESQRMVCPLMPKGLSKLAGK